MTNEIAELLEVRPLFPEGGIDCGAWLPVHLEDGPELDFCAVCGEPHDSHPSDGDDDD